MNHDGCLDKPICPPTWVATETYVAVCLGGSTSAQTFLEFDSGEISIVTADWGAQPLPQARYYRFTYLDGEIKKVKIEEFSDPAWTVEIAEVVVDTEVDSESFVFTLNGVTFHLTGIVLGDVILATLTGATGNVKVTRQCRSYISLAHAKAEAAKMAELEAKSLLTCRFVSTATVTGTCDHESTRTGISFISLADAHQNAIDLATSAAAAFCYVNPLGGNEESKLPRTPMDDVAIVLIVHPGYTPLLQAAILSIERQTLHFGRKILVYDAAFDPKAPAIEVPQDWSVIVGNWRNPNMARTAALAYLQETQWVCFWDADNRMPDTYFQIALRVLASTDARVAVCYPNVQEIFPDGTFGFCHLMPEKWDKALAQWKSIADTASFWRIAALNEVRGFDRHQHGHDDYALSLALFRRGWRGAHSGATINHLRHAAARSATRPLTQSLWTAYSFAFVTLWSGNRDTAHEVLTWLATADIPPRSALYWVDNSGGELAHMLFSVYQSLLSKRFSKIVFIAAGEPYEADADEPYKHLRRHSHVAHLYNQVLPGLSEDMVVTLEDDTLPPRDGMFKLLENFTPGSTLAMAAGVYRARHNPAHICASLDKRIWRHVPKWDELPGVPFEVGMTGGGFAIIANHLLQTCLPMRCEQTEDGRLMGWDGNLGLSFTAMGFKMIVDPRVRCRHLCQEVVDFEAGRPWKPQSYGYDYAYEPLVS